MKRATEVLSLLDMERQGDRNHPQSWINSRFLFKVSSLVLFSKDMHSVKCSYAGEGTEIRLPSAQLEDHRLERPYARYALILIPELSMD